MIRGLISLLKPMDVPGNSFVRIGQRYDGGYVMLDSGLDNAIAYSVGIGNDASWEVGMTERNCLVYQYDHTIGSAPTANEKCHFFSLGIAEENSGDGRLRTLFSLIESNGHNHRNDLILKMDIEGNEWKVLAAVEPETLMHFSQIVVEFHRVLRSNDEDHSGLFMAALSNLNATHQSVHVHANNCGARDFLEGFMIPDALEITYVRRRDHEFASCSRQFPTPLDQPNRLDKEEYSYDFLLD